MWPGGTELSLPPSLPPSQAALAAFAVRLSEEREVRLATRKKERRERRKAEAAAAHRAEEERMGEWEEGEGVWHLRQGVWPLMMWLLSEGRLM